MRDFYAPTFNPNGGSQSAYDAGLTWFPDGFAGPTMYPSPLGLDFGSLAGTLLGTAVAGPAGGAVGASVPSVLGQLTGGTAVDQARQARVNYFAQLAAAGNVAAMQLILGAPANVSGNESQMWVNAATAIKSTAPDVYQAAQDAGPYWLVNSGDTATNYPAMRAYVQNWAASHPLTSLAGVAQSTFGGLFTPSPTTPGAPVVHSGPSPVLLIGLGIGAYLLLKRRRA